MLRLPSFFKSYLSARAMLVLFICGLSLAIKASPSIGGDSLDIMAIHYKVFIDKDQKSDLTDMIVYIGPENIIVTKKYTRDGDKVYHKRFYPIGTDRNYVMVDGTGKSILQENKSLYDVKLRIDSTYTLLGISCYLATYRMNGIVQKAFYTDVFGVNFNAIANIPGVALYCEEQTDAGQIQYVADWVRPMRLPKKLLQLPPSVPDIDSRIKMSVRDNLRKDLYGRFYWKREIIDNETASDLTWFDFTPISGKKRSQKYFNNRLIVVQQLHEEGNKKNITNSTAYELSKKYKGQPVKFILLTDSKSKKYKDDAFHRRSNLDIISGGSKFIAKNELPATFAYQLFDEDGRHCETFHDALNMDLLEDAISYYLGEPAVYTRLVQ